MKKIKVIIKAKSGVAKAQGGKLLPGELKALSHMTRGRRSIGAEKDSYEKKSGEMHLNKPFTPPTRGKLTPAQAKQLKEHMDKASLAQKAYETLPNFGKLVGKSAADIPAKSQLRRQKNGGKVKAKGGGKMGKCKGGC